MLVFKRNTLVKIAILLVCAHVQSCYKADSQFEKVLKSPESYNEQRIEISGVIHRRFEDTAIYLTKDSPMASAVWIEHAKLVMDSITFKNLDGKNVKVKGKFYMTEKGHLARYVGTLKEAIIEIDE